MGKRVHFFLGAVGLLLLLGLFLGRGGADTAVLRADDPDETAHLPAVFKPEPTLTPSPTATFSPWPPWIPDPDNPVRNPSFEEGWETIEFGNQRPKKWQISWVQPGDPLYDAPDLATGICECVHKLAEQLPGNEQPGGPDALILSGTTVYKLFSGQAWGTTISQTLDLEPGSEWRLSVPVQLHNAGDTDAFGAESGVWVNDFGGWSNIEGMGDRQWCTHTRDVLVPDDGQLQIDIRFKSKRPLVKNFFIDDLRLVPAGAPDAHPDIDDCVLTSPLDTYKPYRP